MKKARQFDFMAMFEETRKTAVERSEQNLAVAVQDEEEREEKLTSSFKSTLKDVMNKEENAAGPSKEQEEQLEEQEEEIGPPLPPGMKTFQREDEEDEDDESEEEEDDNPLLRIPTSKEIVLDHGDKAASAIALDPAGARLVTGGFDYQVKFWDFQGMNTTLNSFRTTTPCDRHPVKHLEYSHTGDMILVVTGHAKAKVVDRDGHDKLTTTKGDMYLIDMAATKGHCGMLNGGCWSPKIKEEFMTCSMDGTVRLWNMWDRGKHHQNCIKPRSKQGRKTIPTACTYSKDGQWVCAASQDGSIQVWDHRKSYVNVAMKNMTAHSNGTDTSCLKFSYDNLTLASRGGDDTLKLWDVRKFRQPIAEASNLPNLYPMTDCLFSPDDRMLCTGVSVGSDEICGKLVFLERQTLKVVSETLVAEKQSVVRTLWHPKLNQIVVGLSDGNVKILYDPDKSHRGAKLCAIRAKTQARKQSEIMLSKNIITPHALKIFRENKPSSTRRQEEKARKDPKKSRRPDLPVSGPGHGGRLGNKGATLSQFVVQTLIKRKPDDRDKDPRAAILRHAEEAAKNPFWIDPAYKKNQPNPIFQRATNSDDEKEDDDIEPVWKKAKK
ncbi:hypothetical protein CAPTEDRAFT_205054 [Capitella teleta]|uniref:Uncharacterized protein n=1 Tax=Capitella teleta TaxID=283909 RepID=R7TFF9_CAPTE|nr:hypothetical protein CAPTEDRAFT_205054 [Capitella teleta]|eukprot:ELT90276.1 hypothetical protein CAPTEDRAFT_205054 [Capitella teleta]